MSVTWCLIANCICMNQGLIYMKTPNQRASHLPEVANKSSSSRFISVSCRSLESRLLMTQDPFTSNNKEMGKRTLVQNILSYSTCVTTRQFHLNIIKPVIPGLHFDSIVSSSKKTQLIESLTPYKCSPTNSA